MTFSPASLFSVLKCPITSIGQLHDNVILLQLQESFRFVVLLCKLELLVFKTKRYLQKFKKPKTKCSQMSSSWKLSIGQSSVSGHQFRTLAKPAYVTFFFQLYLKTAISTSIFRSFYLQFILCILAIGRNRSSRAKKKKGKAKQKQSCTFKAAGLSISSRSGSQMVTWLMDWSTVVVWITSSDKFCSKPERPGLTRTLRMPGAPCVLSRSWAANGWICRKQYIRKWG